MRVVLATLGFFSFFSGSRKNWPLLFACVWALTGVVVLTVITPDPLRYRLNSRLAGSRCSWRPLLGDDWSNGIKEHELESATHWIATLVLGVVLGSIAAYLAAIELHRPLSLPLELPLFGAAIVAAYGIVAIMRRLQPRTASMILALLLVFVSVPQWIAGERQVSHELTEAAQRLDKYPDNYVLGGGWGVRLGFSSKRNAYFFWTPESTPKVDLFVEDPVYLKDIPLPWHEVERHIMRRLPLEIAFVRIDR